MGQANDAEAGASGRQPPRLADFAGRWRVSRIIDDDRMGGQAGTFAGDALFQPRPDGALYYAEEGELRLGPGPSFRAMRSYLWRAEGGRIVVDHGDGRPFHSFEPAAPAAEHLCGADLYVVRYDFAAWPRWRAEWTVRGPRKDYAMVSDFAPLGASAG